MKLMCTLALFLSAALLVGCNRSSAPGGPGAKKDVKDTTTTKTTTTEPDGDKKTTITKTTDTDNNDSKNTFTVTVPKEVNVTQGATNNTSISISRGSNFKQAVKLSFKGPAPIKISPDNPSIAGDQNSTDIVVTADVAAPVGKHEITVTGTPETGAPTSVKMTVDVQKK